ncbi:MAG: AMP-binding protein [Devosiaceae bacterium]
MSIAEHTAGTTTKPRACPSWGNVTFVHVLNKWADTRADVPFIHRNDGRTLTYGQTSDQVKQLAAVLSSQGLRPGDSLLLRSGRRVEGLLLLLAAWRLGLNVCLVPESLSARQITEGAVSYAPKMAVDAGTLPKVEAHELRIMEAAASLFTIRLVGCFGNAPDGVIDLESLPVTSDELAHEEDVLELDIEQDAQMHTLHAGADGKLERFSRSQINVLSQALACAMATNLHPSSVVGTAYDPGGIHGLLAAALPCLLVGSTLQLFDALDPSLDARLQLWHEESSDHRLVLPAVFAAQPAFVGSSPVPRSRCWIASGCTPVALPADDTVLVDCGGTALVPAHSDGEGQLVCRPGAITLKPETGDPLSFGTLRLEGTAQSNATSGSLMSGQIALVGPLVAARNGKNSDMQITNQYAKLAEDDDRKPLYVLLEQDTDAIRVGPYNVLLPAVNRALGLTGRWQDAAVFAVPDPLLGHRLEVAVEPRAGDDDAQKLPTLDNVRTMLRESGIGDAALPVKMHLVTRVPRRGRGYVDVTALPGYLIEETGEPVSDVFASQAVA